MSIIRSFFIPAILCAGLAFAACSDDAPAEGDILSGSSSSGSLQSASSSTSSALALVSVSPARDATNVLLDTTITLTFNHSVDDSTLPGNFILTKWWDNYQYPGSIEGNFDFSNNPVVVFTPLVNLESDFEYRLHLVASNILDLGGKPLTASSDIYFETGYASASVLPKVVSTNPTNNTSAVYTSSAIQIKFSKYMAQSTIKTSSPANASDTVRLYPTGSPSSLVNGVISTSDKTNFVFTPQSALTGSTSYTLFISKDVKDLAGTSQGNGMASDYTASFTTAAGEDPTPLTVTSVSPTNSATGVAVSSIVRLVFDKPLQATSVFLDYPGTAGSIRVSRFSDGSFPESGKLVLVNTATNATVTFYLDEPAAYEAGRTWHIRVNGVKALSGASMASTFASSFSTLAPTLGTIADLRATNGPCAIKVENVYMTFYRNYPDNYRACFLQETREGPAIMVLVDSSLAPFHSTDYVYPTYSNVDITVSRVDEYAGMKQVSISALTDRNANKTLDWVYPNLVTVISNQTIGENYEARYLQIDGTLSHYEANTSVQNRSYRLNYAGKYVRLLVNQSLIMDVTKSTSAAAAMGKKVRVLAPLQQDKKGYFIKPYYYSTNAQMTPAALAQPANYPYMLDIIHLAD